MSLPLTAEGEFALVRQPLEKALKLFSRPMKGRAHDHDMYALLADIAAQQHDLAALQLYAPLAEETATRYSHSLYQGIAQRAWGVAHWLAGEYVQADARLRHALELFQGLDTRWQMGRTLFVLGEVAVARSNRVEARDYFSRALVKFEEMKAKPDMARTRALLEQLA
jgi:tetratricopeptide (TPR) repeat protein